MESSATIGEEQVLIVREAVNAIEEDKDLLNELTEELRKVTNVYKRRATFNKRKVAENATVFPNTGKCTKQYDKRKGNY